MRNGTRPLVYTIGLEPLTARAVYADLKDATIRRRRPLKHGETTRRAGRRPDLVVLDVTTTRVVAELAAARAAWGDRLVIVGIGRRQPYARVWQRPDDPELVEVGPGFLKPYLPKLEVPAPLNSAAG